MSGAVEQWPDRRRNDVEWRAEIKADLREIKDRLTALETDRKDKADRRRHVREFFADFGLWVGYGGKLVGALAVIAGTIYATILWIAQNGG